MGLIREPKNIDFSVQSKPWTEKELQDFRKLMIELKAKNLPVGKPKAKRKLVSVVRRKKVIA
jgi:hypothetical protein